MTCSQQNRRKPFIHLGYIANISCFANHEIHRNHYSLSKTMSSSMRCKQIPEWLMVSRKMLAAHCECTHQNQGLGILANTNDSDFVAFDIRYLLFIREHEFAFIAIEYIEFRHGTTRLVSSDATWSAQSHSTHWYSIQLNVVINKIRSFPTQYYVPLVFFMLDAEHMHSRTRSRNAPSSVSLFQSFHHHTLQRKNRSKFIMFGYSS